MKTTLLSILFILASIGLKAQSDSFEFPIINTDNGLVIQSCISEDYYEDDFVYPRNPDVPYKTGSKYVRENPFTVIGLSWKNNCLIIPYPQEFTREQIKEFITVLTTLEKDEIVITFKENTNEK